MISLFKEYPQFSRAIGYHELGDFPTPIEKLHRLGSRFKFENLFIKRDDLSSKLYGGNKVRKLEFIFGDAIKRNKRVILTFGLAGSNHALASAVYSHELDIRCLLMLLPQPNARYVRKNLLLDYYYGAKLAHHRNVITLAARTGYELARNMVTGEGKLLIIPPGGSSLHGIIGFVNAAFELRDQVNSGVMPEPDYIYVPLGSMGTAVGLMIGLKAAGLKSKVVSVRVVDTKYAGPRKMLTMLARSSKFLTRLDSTFPLLSFKSDDVIVRDDFFGEQYGLFTSEGAEASRLAKSDEDLILDGTYTAKTLAAILTDIQNKKVIAETILYWHTYCPSDVLKTSDRIDYRDLPRSFHKYFISDVQPLDHDL